MRLRCQYHFPLKKTRKWLGKCAKTHHIKLTRFPFSFFPLPRYHYAGKIFTEDLSEKEIFCQLGRRRKKSWQLSKMASGVKIRLDLARHRKLTKKISNLHINRDEHIFIGKHPRVGEARKQWIMPKGFWRARNRCADIFPLWINNTISCLYTYIAERFMLQVHVWSSRSIRAFRSSRRRSTTEVDDVRSHPKSIRNLITALDSQPHSRRSLSPWFWAWIYFQLLKQIFFSCSAAFLFIFVSCLTELLQEKWSFISVCVGWLFCCIVSEIIELNVQETAEEKFCWKSLRYKWRD